jgi:hypothetical protein
MTPRTQALAFRLWQQAESVGWDCTAHDLADALSTDADRIHVKSVRRICREKGWTERLRVTDASTTYAPWLHSEQMETARHVRRTLAGDW